MNSTNYVPFMKFKGLFISLSVFLILTTFYFAVTKGINFGVDFKGGIKMVYQFEEDVGDGRIRDALEPLQLGDFQVVRYGKPEEKTYLIKAKSGENSDVGSLVTARLVETMGRATQLSEETVGPKVGSELRERGILAMLLTWVFMLIYVGFRFDFLFAPGAVIALIHDVLIGFGFFIFFGKEVNLPILAAALTLIGYSVNDTIVTYDRVRENLRKLPSSLPLADLVNRSIHETMRRTIFTSLTTLFVMIVVFFVGGAVLHDFAFFMVVGVVAGTYSTIFIATPSYLLFARWFPHRGMLRSSKR